MNIDGGGTPDAETVAFEEQVLRRTVGEVAAGLVEIVRIILAAFEGTRLSSGGTITEEQAQELGRLVADRLKLIRWEPMRPRLAEAAVSAHRLGVQRAARRFPDRDDEVRASSTKTPARRSVPNVDAVLRKTLKEAQTLARQGIRTQTEAAAVAGRVNAGKAKIEGSARSVANEGINAGTAAVARTMKLRLIWVAERNACLDCLAHAGHAVTPGKLFPGVSFDPGKKSAVVEHPPLHPNCRCQVRTFDGPAGPPPKDRSSLSPAARLAAEARRSVVYQWTAYESNPAMRRAAEALLTAGAGLPASVEQRARRMLRKGGGKKK